MAEGLRAGDEVGGYRLDSVLGRGGMGVVFVATDLRLGRRVALKVIAPERARDQGFRQRFERESQLAAALEHPHAVPVYEVGEAADGEIFIAMRLIEGTDLRALLRDQQWLEPGRAVGLVGQVAGALDEAHRRGLVHRDVKPANLLIGDVGGDEWAYLTDFGATKLVSGTDLTGTGEWLGTVDYASPEQIGGKSVDSRSDVYSLGCVLFEALTGRIPFEREEQVAKLYAHLQDPPPRPSELDPELPAGIDEVIARALAKDPAERHPSAGDLGRAAEAALAPGASAGGEGSVATGEAEAGVGAADQPTRALGVRTGGPARGLTRRLGRRAWVAVGAIAAGVAAAALALLLLGGGEGEPELVAEIAIGGAPLGVAVGEGSVWATNNDADALVRIDPAADEPTGDPIAVGSDPVGTKVGLGSVWVANSGSGTVSRVDPDSLEVTATVPVGERPSGIRPGEGAVWVTNVEGGTVSRIDPASLEVTKIEVGGAPTGITTGEGAVWVADYRNGSVSRIDPGSGEVVGDPIEVGGGPRGIAAEGGSVWVSNTTDGTVSRIDPDGGSVVDEIEVGPEPGQVAVGESWVWVTIEDSGTVVRIDPESGSIVGDPLAVGSQPRALALGENSVWVANVGDGTISRIRP